MTKIGSLKALVAAVATSTILCSSPAISALPTASAVEQFGKCAASKYEGAELLATQPGSAEEAEVIAEFDRRACHPPIKDAGILRGALAEQLFKTDFGSIGAQPRRELIEVFTIDLRELEALDDNAKKRIDYVAFGTCVAASDPQRSSKLLTTTPESNEEKAILTELIPQFAGCLAEGERFTFSRADLRGSLAEGAYRLALSQSLDEEVVVTGTRDTSKSVQCRLQDVAGTRLRRNICRTEAQWAERKRNAEYGAAEIKRRADEFNDIQTAIITRSRFPGGS